MFVDPIPGEMSEDPEDGTREQLSPGPGLPPAAAAAAAAAS